MINNISDKQLIGNLFINLSLCTYQSSCLLNFRWLTTLINPDTNELQRKILAIKDQAKNWIDNLATDLSAGLASSVISYITTFQASISGISDLCQGPKNTPLANDKKNQITEILGMISSIKPFNDKLLDCKNRLNKFHSDFNALNEILTNAILAYQGNISEIRDIAKELNLTIDKGYTVISEINDDIINLFLNSDLKIALSTISVTNANNITFGSVAFVGSADNSVNSLLIKILQNQFQKNLLIKGFNELSNDNKQISFLLLITIPGNMINISLGKVEGLYKDLGALFQGFASLGDLVKDAIAASNVTNTEILNLDIFSDKMQNRLENILKYTQDIITMKV